MTTPVRLWSIPTQRQPVVHDPSDGHPMSHTLYDDTSCPGPTCPHEGHCWTWRDVPAELLDAFTDVLIADLQANRHRQGLAADLTALRDARAAA